MLSANYSFSKRTDVYLNIGYAKNKNGSTQGLSGSSSTFVVAGENQTGATIGLCNRF